MRFFKSMILIFIMSSVAHANSVATGSVKVISMDRSYSTGKVFIKVSGDKSNNPGCHNNSSWSYVLPLVDELDKAIFSSLLSAHATEKEVQLEGKGLCDFHSNIETLTYIRF